MSISSMGTRIENKSFDVQREEILINLTKTLREEANFVKDCFTRFSFHSLAISAVVLGIIARCQADYPCVAFASILVIILLLSVARIGTYKYGTANRNFGYELHLSRTKNQMNKTKSPKLNEDAGNIFWDDEMRYIAWEEAMRAWRVVQATIFDYVYETHWFKPNRLRSIHNNVEYKWFIPSELIDKGASYHAGSYLRTMHSVLHLSAFLCVIPLCLMAYQYYSQNDSILFVIGLSITVCCFVAIIWRVLKNGARRKILEGELLCIHSCSILWQAVVLAHYRAKRKAFSESRTYRNYTKYLSQEAKDLKNKFFEIHLWMSNHNEKQDNS